MNQCNNQLCRGSILFLTVKMGKNVAKTFFEMIGPNRFKKYIKLKFAHSRGLGQIFHRC